MIIELNIFHTIYINIISIITIIKNFIKFPNNILSKLFLIKNFNLLN